MALVALIRQARNHCHFFFFGSFNMASPDNTLGTGDHSNYSTVSASEPRRKVSILTDPPHNAGGYDNLAYIGTGRKISQVRIKIRILRDSLAYHVFKCLVFRSFSILN